MLVIGVPAITKLTQGVGSFHCQKSYNEELQISLWRISFRSFCFDIDIDVFGYGTCGFNQRDVHYKHYIIYANDNNSSNDKNENNNYDDKG